MGTRVFSGVTTRIWWVWQASEGHRCCHCLLVSPDVKAAAHCDLGDCCPQLVGLMPLYPQSLREGILHGKALVGWWPHMPPLECTPVSWPQGPLSAWPEALKWERKEAGSRGGQACRLPAQRGASSKQEGLAAPRWGCSEGWGPGALLNMCRL